MALIKWDPFREFGTSAKLGRFFGDDWELAASTTSWNPPVDIFDTDSEIIVKAELPGMNAKDIDVRLENNVLTVKGKRKFEKETKEENYHRVERAYGTFSRSFSLPTAVTSDKVTAEYKNGILTIVLPKQEEIRPKPIKIEAT